MEAWHRVRAWLDRLGRWPARGRRALLWSVLVFGLLTMWAGASWDVSGHFRTTNDAANPAHAVNLAGRVVLVGAMLWAWLARLPEERRPIQVFLVGSAISLVAVPLDLAWHKIHGLDLTTWSPTHIPLFYGSAVAAAGIAMLLLAHVGWRWGRGTPAPRLSVGAWALLSFLLARTLAPLLFAGSFNEYAAVAARNLASGQSIYRVDSTLVDFAAGFRDMPYGDLPHLLYPAYTIAVALAFLVAVRRLSGTPWLATAAAGLYVLGRVLPDLAMRAVGYPVAAIPYHILLVGLCVDLAFLLRTAPALRATVAALLATNASFAWWAWGGRLLYTVPLDWDVLPWVALIALAAAVAAATVRLPAKRARRAEPAAAPLPADPAFH